MTLGEFLSSENKLIVLAGMAGAAAMAATDWRGPKRFLQHLFVGTLAANFATPFFYPVLSSVMNAFGVPPELHDRSATFIVGAMAIYIMEFIIVFWRDKASGRDKEK